MRATDGRAATPAANGERTEEQRTRRSLLLWGGAGALVALVLTLAIGLPLAHHHAAQYQLTPDFSAGGWPVASSWAAPLAGAIVGMLLLGAAAGLMLYGWGLNPYARIRPIWQAAYFWRIAVLAVLGWTLVSNGRAAAEDITVAVPEQVTGFALSHTTSQGFVLQSYALDLGSLSMRYTMSAQQVRTYSGKCVAITYGPESHIAFRVQALPRRTPPPNC